jgi:hypothetical protein
MSTIVIIQQPGAVHLITDAGQYDPATGALVNVRSKVVRLPSGVAFAWRGAGGDWPETIALRLAHYASFDAILIDISEIADRVFRTFADGASAEGNAMPAGGWEFEIYLAGFSRSSGRVGCAWLTSAAVPSGSSPEASAAPFAMREAPAFIMGPAPAQSLDAILGYRLDADAIDRLDPATDGLALIEAQRRTPSAGGYYVAGGRAELTTITAGGVARSVLATWPDVIGRPIEP